MVRNLTNVRCEISDDDLCYVVSDPAAFTWDVRLAMQLLAHTGKVKDHGGRCCKSEFWEKYLRLLPDPADLCQPFCLSPSALDEFQHSALKAGAQAQQHRLRMLLPEMMPSEDAQEAEHPSALQWAFACVRSRAFEVSSKSSANSDPLGKEGGVVAVGARGSREEAKEAIDEDKDKADGESAPRFQPSAAAVAEAKAAAKKSGGFAMLIPGSAATAPPPLVAASGGASAATSAASGEVAFFFVCVIFA